MKNKTITVVWGVAVLIAIGVGVYFLTRSTVDDSNIKSGFMSGCMEEGNYAFCDCSYESIKSQIGVDGLIKFSLEYDRTGVLPKEAYTAIASCLDKVI
jgi:hypothetical protein